MDFGGFFMSGHQGHRLTVVVRQADDVVDLQAFAEAYARALLAEAAAERQDRAA